MSKNPKNWWKSLKIANIARENLHIFWTTCGISIELSGKMWLMITLKVTKNQGFTLPLFTRWIFEKTTGKGGEGSNWPPSPSSFRVKIKKNYLKFCENFSFKKFGVVFSCIILHTISISVWCSLLKIWRGFFRYDFIAKVASLFPDLRQWRIT